MTYRSAVLAAILAAGEDTVASHRSASVIWGLVYDSDARVIEVTSPERRRLLGVTAHRHSLPRSHRTVRDRIPVTSIERTLVDLAECEDAVAIGAHIDAALRRQLTTLARLESIASEVPRGGKRRIAPLREALADRSFGYRPGANDWEREMDRRWEAMGLPPAEVQYRIRVAGGRSLRPDRAIVEAKIAVDWNGYDAHGGRNNFDADSRRRGLLSAAGWFPLDFTSRSTPAHICATVLSVYRRRMAGSL